MSRRVSRLIGAADGRVQWSGVAVVFLLGRNRWTGGDVQCGGDLRLLIDFVVSVVDCFFVVVISFVEVCRVRRG